MVVMDIKQKKREKKKNADMKLGLKDTCISLVNGLKLKEVSRQRLWNVDTMIYS